MRALTLLVATIATLTIAACAHQRSQDKTCYDANGQVTNNSESCFVDNSVDFNRDDRR